MVKLLEEMGNKLCGNMFMIVERFLKKLLELVCFYTFLKLLV